LGKWGLFYPLQNLKVLTLLYNGSFCASANPMLLPGAHISQRFVISSTEYLSFGCKNLFWGPFT
jgi:hypothetical protein